MVAKYVSYKQLDWDTKLVIIDWYREHSSSSTKIKFNISLDTLNKILIEFNVKKHNKGESIKLSCLEKYGVANPS